MIMGKESSKGQWGNRQRAAGASLRSPGARSAALPTMGAKEDWTAKVNAKGDESKSS